MKFKRILSGLMATIMITSVLSGVPTTDTKAATANSTGTISTTIGKQPDHGKTVDIGTSDNSWMLKSPSGNTILSIKLDNKSLKYSVTQDGTTIVEESSMGIATSKGDFTNGLTYKSANAKVIHETYKNLSGNQSINTNHAHEATFTFTRDNVEFQVIARAYDDGIAFRYAVNSEGTMKIDPDKENTSFQLPENSTLWYMNYHGKTGDFMYESEYETTNINSIGKDSNIIASMPMTYAVGNKYAMITEAEKSGTYVGSFLQPAGNRVLKTIFDKKQTTAVETTAPFKTPWRTVVIGDLSTIATNTMVENLSPEPDAQYQFNEWVQPGVSSWSWVANWGSGISDQSQKETHMNWIDLASQMGWRYYILDEGWQPRKNSKPSGNDYSQKRNTSFSLYEGMRDWFNDVRTYAKENNVDLIAWVDMMDMDTPAEREARFKAWSEAGIKGIKIDFFYYEDQNTLKLQEEIYKTAAKYHMLVNVHGSNPPSGERRTYPNVLAREAIRGQEQGGIKAEQYTLIPFIRSAVGTADVTEELYSKDTNNTSMGFQIALSVLIENGIRSLGGRPADYLGIPAAVSDYKNFPEKWDETKLLDSKIGDYVNIARKSGNGWYAAGISVNEKNLSLKTDFLEDNVTYTAVLYHEKDNTERRNLKTEVQKNITKNSTLNFHIQKGGGYAVKLYPQTNALESVEVSSSEITVPAKSTKNINISLTPSHSGMTDFEWKVADATIASIEASSTGAVIKGLKEGITQITGTSAFDASKSVTIDVEVTPDPYPLNSEWTIINDNGKYKAISENSVQITTENGVINNNVFSMSIPDNADNFSIEAKISGGLNDNYQGGFIGVFKPSLGEEYIGVGRRYHTSFTQNGVANLFAMMSQSPFEQYAADPAKDKDAYVKLEKTGNKYIGYYRQSTTEEWKKISETTKTNLSNSKDLRIGFFAGCGGGNTATTITFSDFKFNEKAIKFATKNPNAMDTYETLELEAELGTLSNNAKMEVSAEASNQCLVGNIGGENKGTVTFTIPANEAGSRTIYVYVAQNDTRAYQITVNNSQTLNLTCPSSGSWTKPSDVPAAISVNLKKGTNTISFSGVGTNTAPDLDRIEIKVTPDEAKVLVENLIAALPEAVTTADRAIVHATSAAYNNYAGMSDADTVTGLDKLSVALVIVGETTENEALKIAKAIFYQQEGIVESLNPEQYTEDSWLLVEQAYENAQAEFDKGDGADAAKLQDLTNKLIAAINGLKTTTYTFTVSFDSGNGSDVPEQYVDMGNPAKQPEAPTRPGYNFAGWYLDGKAYHFDTPVTASITLYALWVTPDVNVGALGDYEVYEQEVLELLENPENESLFTEESWTQLMTAYDKAKAEFDKGDARNWDTFQKYVENLGWAIKELSEIIFTVTFNTDGGTPVDAQEVFSGEYAEEPLTEKNGYVFAGWYLNETKFDFETPIENNLTLMAKWNPKTTDATTSTTTTTETNLVTPASVAVVEKVKEITINGASNKIAAGKKVSLTASISPDSAANQDIRWTSSEPRYAKVSASGVVTTTKSGAGKTVTIIAAAQDGSGVTATYKIKIMPKAITQITLKGSKTVRVGNRARIKATITPNLSDTKVYSKLAWTVSDSRYATVNAMGVVRAKEAGKGHTVRITARTLDGSNKKASVKIRIK